MFQVSSPSLTGIGVSPWFLLVLYEQWNYPIEFLKTTSRHPDHKWWSKKFAVELVQQNSPDPFRIYIYNHNYRAIDLTSFNTHSPHKCGKYITMPPWWNPQPWCLPPRAPKTEPQWMPRARRPIGVAAVCGRRRSWTCRPRRSKLSLEARRGQDDPSTNISNIGVMWLTMLNPVYGGFTWSIMSHQEKINPLIWFEGGKSAGKLFNHLPT